LNSLKKITLLQYRNYASAQFEFDAPVTCITGPNGSGKTNLLDAVYYLCYTKSYFSAYQQNNVQKGADGFRLEGVFLKDERQDIISCKWKQGKKEVAANGVLYDQVADHIGKYAAVMIAPDDIELINDGSELRRKWMDSILGQTDRQYLERLVHYQRILAQRNAWLKLYTINPTADSAQLEYYDRELAENGTYIFQQREKLIGNFLPLLESFYRLLSGGKETISMQYVTDLHQKPLSEWLAAGLQADMKMQRTLRGVHRDDWDFILDEQELKSFGSQGQKKSYLFALKLAQFSYINKKLGITPILLLDDIFEKLDQQRMEALLAIIRGPEFGQVLLTDTHMERAKLAFGSYKNIDFIAV
jgi:DNA replication and repair protein RecF